MATQSGGNVGRPAKSRRLSQSFFIKTAFLKSFKGFLAVSEIGRKRRHQLELEYVVIITGGL